MSDNRLSDFAARLDRIEEERQAVLADAREVYKEAKGEGYNVKALRRVLADRRKPTDAALEADLEMYRALLGEPGATYRSVSEKVGIPRSTLHRLVPRASHGTGVGREMTADDLGDPMLVIDKPRAQFREKVRAIAASVKIPVSPAISGMTGDIEMPPIPAFLDRRTA